MPTSAIPNQCPVARFVARRDARIDDVRPERSRVHHRVVAGTRHEQYLRALFTEAEVVLYEAPAREALRRGETDLLFGDGFALSFWLNGTDRQLLRVRRRPVP